MCFMCVDDVEWELLDWGSTGWIVRPENVPDGVHLCVLDVTPDGLRLVELAPGVTEDEVREKTEPALLDITS